MIIRDMKHLKEKKAAIENAIAVKEQDGDAEMVAALKVFLAKIKTKEQKMLKAGGNV